ncbi:MAG TPA: hypothetical protein VN428_25820 [Bryobacteraceae bacterium]|nr:hypothetical protein [Bryobacteraceae bacterium]
MLLRRRIESANIEVDLGFALVHVSGAIDGIENGGQDTRLTT